MKKTNVFFRNLRHFLCFIMLILMLLASSFLIGCDIWEDIGDIWEGVSDIGEDVSDIWDDDENYDNYYPVNPTLKIPKLLETGSGNAYDPHMAMDVNGNVIAVWQQYDGSYYSIYSNRYIPGTGWGKAELLETGSGDAYDPQIAMDVNGNGIAVWRQGDGSYNDNNIYSNRYTPGTGWGTAELIETDSVPIQSLQIAIDSNGNAIVVWKRYFSPNNIYSNRYTSGIGWGTAEFIGIGSEYYASYLQIAMDVNGNAIAVWSQHDGSNDNIYSNRYTPGTGWGIAELIGIGSGYSWYLHIAMDVNGNAIIVWSQYDDSYYSIYSNRYIPGTGWGTAELIETGSGGAHSPQIAIDSNGNAIAVWYQSDGIRDNIYSNRYISGAWGTAELVGTCLGSAYFPKIAMNSKGNAIVVWFQSETSYYNKDYNINNIWSNRYTPGKGWGTAGLIETGLWNAWLLYPLQIAIDPNGNAIAVWVKSDGIRNNIWSNSFK